MSAPEPDPPSAATQAVTALSVSRVLVPSNHVMTQVLGPHDELLDVIEDAFSESRIHVRGNEITVEGEDAQIVTRVFEEMVVMAERGQPVDGSTLDRIIDMVRADERPSEVLTSEITRLARGG